MGSTLELENKFKRTLDDLFAKGILTYGDPTKTLYTDGQAAVPASFKGREEELKKIRRKLHEGGRVVVLKGDGGIGKTTLAARYVEEQADHYDNKAWVFCRDGIVQDLKNLINDPAYFQDCVTEDQVVQKLRMALLVLDNLNNPDDLVYFRQTFRELSWHVLITSRYGGKLENEFPVKHLPEEKAKELFREFYQEEGADFESQLDRVLKAIGYNTLLIEIFAKNLFKAHHIRRETMATFLKKLGERGLYLEKGSFTIDSHYLSNIHKAKVGETANTDQILEVLYDFSTLTEPERYWLVNMTLLPAQSYEAYFLEELWGFPDESICETYFEPLARKGWLTSENYSYRLSPVVQELVLKKNADTLPADARALLQNLAEKLDNEGGNFKYLSLSQAAPFALLASSITQRLQQSPTYELSSLNFNAGLYFENTGDVVQAKQAYEQYAQLSAAIGHTYNVSVAYGKLGGIYESIGDWTNAIENYQEYNRLENEIHQSSPENLAYKNNLAVSYQKLGGIYEASGEWKNALKNYQERNRIGLEIHQSSPENLEYKNGLAISYYNLGNIELRQNELPKAVEYMLKSRTLFAELWQATHGQNVRYTYSFSVNTKYVTEIFKWMIQNEYYKEEAIPELTEQIKQMRREGYTALQPLAEAGTLHDSQLGLVSELADESWYEF